VLVVNKTGPATMNLGQLGNFALDVQNTGSIDAWNVSLRDLLPDGPTGGMCDLAPQILSARVFAADGVTPVPGKGPLVAGIDYSLTWSPAPACRLDLTMLTAAGRIGPNERLIVSYRTQLDAGTQNGITLTNVAGAIQWFNGDSNNPNRVVTNRTLTNGTPGILDHEDAHTVTVNLVGYFFDKTVADLTSGANPATTAAPGDTLRYTLRFQTTNTALAGFRIFDEMDALNATADFAPGTLTLVTVPAGADASNTNGTGGAKGTGVLDIRNLSLPLNSPLLIQFDITLKPVLANGTVVTDQATARKRQRHDGSVERRPERQRRRRSPGRGRRGSHAGHDRLGAEVPGSEDFHGPDRRSERPARRRDAPLHHHGQEHRQRRRRERDAARRGAREHHLRRRQHDPERRGGRGRRGPVAAP